MGAGYLADTNVVIDLVLGRLPEASAMWLDTQLTSQQVAISVITRIELLGKLVPAPEAAFLQSFVQSVEVLPLDEAVIQQTIRLRQQCRHGAGAWAAAAHPQWERLCGRGRAGGAGPA